MANMANISHMSHSFETIPFANVTEEMLRSYPYSIKNIKNVVSFFIPEPFKFDHFLRFVPILLQRLKDGKDQWPIKMIFFSGFFERFLISPQLNVRHWKKVLDMIDTAIQLGADPQSLLTSELGLRREIPYKYPEYPIAMRYYGASLRKTHHFSWFNEHSSPAFFAARLEDVPFLIELDQEMKSEEEQISLAELEDEYGFIYLNYSKDHFDCCYENPSVLKTAIDVLVSIGADLCKQSCRGRTVIHSFSYAFVYNYDREKDSVYFSIYEDMISRFPEALTLEDNDGKTVFDIVCHIPELKEIVERYIKI